MSLWGREGAREGMRGGVEGFHSLSSKENHNAEKKKNFQFRVLDVGT